MDMMIDIETLDTKPTAAIISMAYLMFDPYRPGTLLEKETLAVIDPEIEEPSQFPRTVSWDTIKFHMKLGHTNAYLETQFEVLSLGKALKDLWDYFVDNEVKRVWAQGVCFDIGILENAFSQHDMGTPWRFWDIRDSRTLCTAAKINKKKIQQAVIGDAHNPLYDCRVQALMVQQAMRKIHD